MRHESSHRLFLVNPISTGSGGSRWTTPRRETHRISRHLGRHISQTALRELPQPARLPDSGSLASSVSRLTMDHRPRTAGASDPRAELIQVGEEPAGSDAGPDQWTKGRGIDPDCAIDDQLAGTSDHERGQARPRS
jgi:hypothetical protein